MRRSHLATALVALLAGAAAPALLRRVPRRRPAPAPAVPEVAAAAPSPDAVVLPFVPRVVAAPAPERRPAAPSRCGEAGGRTKAGAPCAARAAAGGRCHHHRAAA